VPADLLAVHTLLDDLQRHLAPHRLGLLGEPDLAHAALAELLRQTVVPDRRSGRHPAGAGIHGWRHLDILGFVDSIVGTHAVNLEARNIG